MRAVLTIGALLAAVGVLLLSDLAARGPRPSPAEPDGARAVAAAGFDGGGFSLIDHRGRQVSAAHYGDKLLLLTFGATASDLGSVTLGLMSRTLACLDADAARLQPLFIALDPDRDDARRLRTYLAPFDSRIAGLRGSPAELERLARSYRVHREAVATTRGRRLVHSAFLYLAEPGGRVHSYYPPTVPAARICADARHLLQG